MAKPEKSFRLGSAVASVFVNDGKEGSFRTIQLQRRYRDDRGDWKSSDSFTSSQAAIAVSVLQQALSYAMERDAAERGSQPDEG